MGLLVAFLDVDLCFALQEVQVEVTLCGQEHHYAPLRIVGHIGYRISPSQVYHLQLLLVDYE